MYKDVELIKFIGIYSESAKGLQSLSLKTNAIDRIQKINMIATLDMVVK